MAFVLTLYGVLGVLAGLLAGSIAWLIYAASPRRRDNRVLGGLLFVEGIVVAAATGLIFLTDDPGSVVAWQLTALTFSPFAYFVFYPLVLGTLGTPLAAPFRSRIVRGALVVTAMGLAASVRAWPERWAPGVHAVNFAPYDAVFGEYAFTYFLATVALSLYALASSADAFRRAPKGSTARARARAFALAFGARDVVLLTSMTLLFSAGNDVLSPLLDAGVLGFTLIPLVYVPLLGYGILKTQLFDIDLKLKFTVRQSTIAATFVAVFFVVSESAAAFLGETTNSTYFGIAAAGLLLFALAPLQRVADRIASAALPSATGSPEYVASRKFDVYRGAVECALAGDAQVTPRERQILVSLRSKLGITEQDAALIEAEVRGA